MNLFPLVGFYYRRHGQISSLLAKSGGENARMFLDFLNANIPVAEKYWPKLNENGLLDDAVATLEAVLTDAPDPGPSPYPDNTQR